MSAPQPGTPRTIYVQWSVDGNHIRKWSWSEFDLAERLNAETVSVSDPKAQALADALQRATGFIEALADNDPDEPIADNGMTVLGFLQYEAPALIVRFRAALADWEGK